MQHFLSAHVACHGSYESLKEKEMKSVCTFYGCCISIRNEAGAIARWLRHRRALAPAIAASRWQWPQRPKCSTLPKCWSVTPNCSSQRLAHQWASAKGRVRVVHPAQSPTGFSRPTTVVGVIACPRLAG